MNTSYSALETFKTCPLKFKYQEIDKIRTPKSKEAVFGTVIHSTMKFIHTPGILSPTLDQALEHFSNNWNPAVFESEAEERAAFSQGAKIVQDYYQKNNPADANIVALESRFQIEVGSEDNQNLITGIVDRIDKTTDGYEIIDYKTTRKMPSQEKVDNDFQLSIYLLSFLRRYPKERENLDKIKVSLYYLKHGVKLFSSRTAEQLKESEDMILELVSEIEKSKFEPVVSPLCDWCGYQKMCPMWKHKFKDERKIDSEEVKDIIEEYINLKTAMNISRQKIGQLQGKIDKYMDQEGVERVFGEGGIVARTMRKSYSYDADKLKTILEPLDKWEDILKVNGVLLNKLIPTLPPENRRQIDEAKEVKEVKSFTVKKS